ncbi:MULTISPECIES: pilus assembly protein PilP [Francisella]|uniref:Pilus assembly protein n=1 Tax=Francisella opportunistica TaxID=2016517 RepID=A0A345JRW7_9GAMM|nr:MULTISPECIES: pilus assembly protein PilP [Francisella]APC91817.1 Type IV pilus biogenesis protein PilP [Francisella sp. MA067296]AXH30063.1 pilus assembly protein [Francisella opportunistica]AXH31707.1 pilus assembly protein [Francisella opportunistica]AXH33353.1 pilus assembly protein [Francisella opportunistica]
MIKNQKFKKIFFIVLISSYNLGFASYDSRVNEVNQLIQANMKSVKSTEKLDIPEYKGDILTFERLSKIRNVFNIEHYLPFEKKVLIIKSQQNKKIELKPIIIPPELQKIMDTKATGLQRYPLDSFKFKGVVYQNNQKWGIVESSLENKPMYLKKGELIGQNYGKVENVTKEGIVVDEWKKNDQKRIWEKIQAVIH